MRKEIDLTDAEIERCDVLADKLTGLIEAEIEEAGEAAIATATVHAIWLSMTRFLATAGWSADELVQEVILSASDATTEGPA